MTVPIPEFEGKLDQEEFQDQLHIIERVFEYEEVSDVMKVNMATLRLRKYDSLGWENKNQ